MYLVQAIPYRDQLAFLDSTTADLLWILVFSSNCAPPPVSHLCREVPTSWMSAFWQIYTPFLQGNYEKSIVKQKPIENFEDFCVNGYWHDERSCTTLTNRAENGWGFWDCKGFPTPQVGVKHFISESSLQWYNERPRVGQILACALLSTYTNYSVMLIALVSVMVSQPKHFGCMCSLKVVPTMQSFSIYSLLRNLWLDASVLFYLTFCFTLLHPIIADFVFLYS